MHCHVNSNAFRFIDHNIIAICLRGAPLNNFENGQGHEPPKPPSHPLLHVPESEVARVLRDWMMLQSVPSKGSLRQVMSLGGHL